MKRRFISILLALAMIFSVVMPATLHAVAEEETEVEHVMWDFEGGVDSIEGWTFIDADGDGFNWKYHSNEGLSTGRNTAHSGDGIIYSQSYDNDTSSILAPDNWAISPAFSLENVRSATLSIWAIGQDPNWALEVFALYAGKTPDPDEMTKVSEDFTATGEYVNYTADLSYFAGEETVYVAIRHYNVEDMFQLNVDDVQINVVKLPDSCEDGAHEMTYFPATTEPTCTEGVHSGYYKCDVCGRTFLDEDGITPVLVKDITTVPALGHDWLQGVSNGDGTHTHSCSRCDATLTEDCTFEETIGNGVSKKVCSECGYTVYSEYSANTILTGWGFEEEPTDWTFVDNNNDGITWTWNPDNPYEGSYAIRSASYWNNPVTPDDWAISPAFSLAGCTGATLSLWATGYSPGWYDEVFAVYAGTSIDNVDDMVKISDDITTEYGYLKYTFDLTAFAGEEAVYIAIRHYNCTDVYYLFVDLVEIYVAGADICEVHDLTYVPAVPPTATEDGNIAYYYCEECGRYYLDEEATQPVLPEDVIIPALGENSPLFTSHRIALTGEVGVQFKVTLPEGFDAAGSSMSFSVSDGRSSTMDIADATPVDGENAYWFTCYINALELADTITATFNFGTDGAITDTYSAMDYISTIQATYDDWSHLYGITRDLRYYGHYLQLSGWTDGKSHTEISIPEGTGLGEVDIEYTRELICGYGYEVEKNIAGTGIEDVKFALTLNSQTVINFFVKLADGVQIEEVNGAELKGEQIIGGDTYFKFNTGEINVTSMHTNHTLTIKTGEGVAEITANAMTYIDLVLREGSTFPVEKQYAMVAYYYFLNSIYNSLVNPGI